MITRIRRCRSGSITIIEEVSIPPLRRGGKYRSEVRSTTYNDWSEVPNAASLKDCVTCDCCGAVEYHLSEPLTDPKLSEYNKKLLGHRWCRRCQSEHKPTKLAHPFSNRKPQDRYSKGMRVFASFGPGEKAQKRKAELLDLVEKLWIESYVS